MSPQPAAAPVLSGAMPPLAVDFQLRQETGSRLADGLRPGETILLVPAAGEDLGGGMAAAGASSGTGKTQLAVGFAHAMWSSRAVDVLVWVAAGNRTAIIAGYAQAAADLNLAAAEETADSAAQRFLSWLRRTSQRWAVVLDGVTSPPDLDGLWPQGPAGQVVVTTGLRASELDGPGRTAYGVPGFSRREALGYLNSRLDSFPDQRIEALDLVEDIDGLPIALAQAAAVIIVAESTCRDYRAEYAQRLQATAAAMIEGCPPPMLATWSLAVEYAHEMPPAGLAWPALAFAAVLDTAGIPAAVLTSAAACGYITGRHDPGGGEQSLVKAAYATLQQLGLASVDTSSAARTVWLHSCVRTAIRAYLAPGSLDQVVQAAAAALLEAWPLAGGGGAAAELGQALRDCTTALRAFAGELLWKPEAHPVLLRAGRSLGEPPVLLDAAVGHWQTMAATCSRLLGPGHAQSVLARGRLADAYAASGRLAEALTTVEAALADRERILGPLHPDTVTARVSAARSLAAAGRLAEAIARFEQAVSARERLFGPAHRETVSVRLQLADAYSAAGRHDDSLRLHEQTLDAAERDLGPLHAATMTARAGLAAEQLTAGRPREAVAGFERTLADRERASGADHPDTLAVRAQLANAYRFAGKLKDAFREYQRVLADRVRTLGDDHPDTISARASLAYAYRTVGRLKDAVPQYERVVAARSRILGDDHRDTIAARGNLAVAYLEARRIREAIDAYERAVADGDLVLGAGDVEALTARFNLAVAYSEGGRLAEAVKLLGSTLADCEQYLGPSHPLTGTVRDHLRAATK
jgi:tetratricopeptide (TPR) repeat protein